MDNEPTESDSPEAASPESLDAEGYRVNVPAVHAEELADGPDTGYALVKYTRDEDGYCLDLQSLRLPAEQPEEENPDDELPLEDFAKKIMSEPAPAAAPVKGAKASSKLPPKE